MELKGMSRAKLITYLERQVGHFFPDGAVGVRDALIKNIDEALFRVLRSINAVRIWPQNIFDPLHTEQNTMFLYFLANTIWQRDGNDRVAAKIYYLNKVLNGFNCYYEVCLPEIFFVGHSLGIVLSRARYSNYFAIYQNSTVGWNNGREPTFEEGIVIFPGSYVMGNCIIRSGSIVSLGTTIIDQNTKANHIVFSKNGQLSFRKPKRDLLGDIFRLEDRR